MLDKQIQEQAEKLQAVIKQMEYSIKSHEDLGEPLDVASWNYQIGILLSVNDAKTLLEAQWIQEREKQTFLYHVNKINLTQRDKDLIKGVYYEFLSLHSPPKD